MLTIPSRHWRILVLAAVLAVAYGVVCFNRVLEAHRFRRTPTDECPGSLSSDLPHNLLARYVLLRHGTEKYHNTLTPCVVSAQLSDTPWNRRIVGNFLALTPEDSFLESIDLFNLAPSRALLDRSVSLWNKGHMEVYPVLGRTSQGRELLTKWRTTRFLANRPYSIAVMHYILALGPEEFRSALKDIQLTANEKEELWSSFPVERRASSLLAFLTAELANNGASLAEVRTVFPALLNSDATARAATALLTKYLDTAPPSVIPTLLGADDCDPAITGHENLCGPGIIIPGATEELYLSALSRAAGDATAAGSIFHAIVHNFPSRAPQVIGDYCKAADSTTTKAVVVLAERHLITPRCPDRAFTGTAPRTVLFRRFDQYLSGSEAVNEYSALAGHGMSQVGKRWPPYYGARQPADTDSDAWGQFVSKYRWFPAVDDAFYRWAYSLFLAGRLADAIAVVDKFSSMTLPDDDSAPYLLHLKLVARSELGDEDIDSRDIVESRNNLPDRDGQEDRLPIENAVDMVDWLVRNRRDISSPVAVDPLRRVRIALDVARSRCADSDINDCSVPRGADTFMGMAPLSSIPQRLLASRSATTFERDE